MEIRWTKHCVIVMMIMQMMLRSCSSLISRGTAMIQQRPRIMRKPYLYMSTTSTTDNSDESLHGILDEVESLLSKMSDDSNDDDTTPTNDDGWRVMDWNGETSPLEPDDPSLFKVASKNELLPSSRLPSPVEKVLVKNRIVYLKRDDLLRLPGSNVSGNKARKLYSLNELEEVKFPSCVVSHGGPQSNAMVALAAIVHSKNTAEETEQSTLAPPTDKSSTSRTKRFVYYTKTLPRFLKQQPSGNLFRAQTLGMELVELTQTEYNNLFGSESGGKSEPPADLDPPVPGDSFWVPQGGACGVAVQGGRMLAQEILSFWRQEGQGRPLSVCVPGGTCTTALLLHREIRNSLQRNGDDSSLDIQVVVIPCVGDDAYARRQMMALNVATGGSGNDSEIPTVMKPFPATSSYFGRQQATDKQGYYTFGQPDADILQTFRLMEDESDVNLDLLYGAPSWTIMLRHWRTTLPTDASATFGEANPLAGREVMYVHSGGLEGVTSQLTRYRYKGLVESEDIQYPTKPSKSKLPSK